MIAPMNITTKTYLIPLAQRPDGEAFHLQVIDLDSGKEGPFLYLQSGLHGNELQGHAALVKLLEIFETQSWKGRVRIVPVCNPLGVSQKIGDMTQGRFEPVSGDNYNRSFFEVAPPAHKFKDGFGQIHLESWAKAHQHLDTKQIVSEFKKTLTASLKLKSEMPQGYAQKLSTMLQLLAAEADLVLDLHTAPIADEYIYSTQKNLNAAKNFLFSYYLIMPEEFGTAMDEAVSAPWWELQKVYAQTKIEHTFPFQSYTLELGSEEVFDLKQGAKQAQKIAHFLYHQGIFDHAPTLGPDIKRSAQYACAMENFKTLFAPVGGMFDFAVSPGTAVKKGELLGNFVNWKNYHSNSGVSTLIEKFVAPEDLIVINRFSSSAIPQGADLFQAMTSWWTI